MNAASTNRTTGNTPTRPAASQQRTRPTAIDRRREHMPRSTTRVIWTRSSGTTVEYGEIL